MIKKHENVSLDLVIYPALKLNKSSYAPPPYMQLGQHNSTVRDRQIHPKLFKVPVLVV